VPTPTPGGSKLGSFVKGATQFVLPIAAGVLIANAIREAAGITPEESAQRQTRGQFGPRSAANVHTPVPVKDVDAAAQAAANHNNLITHFDRGAAEANRAAIIDHNATLRVGDRIGVLKTATVTASSHIRNEVQRLAASERADARTSHSIDRQTASHTAQAVERIRGVEAESRNTSANTAAIRRKNFSPTVDVNVHNAFSISNIINAQKTYSYVTATGRVGGKII
jgi:hypothetical protein